MDTLEIFGLEYTNVAGFKATDDNGNTLTYIRPIGTLTVTTNTTTDVTAYASVVTNIPLGTKTVTDNGTYVASSDSLAGFSSVTVSIPSATGVNF